MHKHVLLIISLAGVTAVFLVGGFPWPAMTLYPAMAAYYCVQRKYGVVATVVFCAFIMPLLLATPSVLSLMFMMAALFGVVLARRLKTGMSLGVSIAVVSIFAYLLILGYTALSWPAFEVEWRTALDVYKTQIQTEKTSENQEIVLGLLNWMDEHWLHISFGMLFGIVIVFAVFANTLVYRKLAYQGWIASENYMFSRMRVPEHLVWLAIALAGLWFVDSRWPNDAVRFLSWNGAIALAVVYWINGLSIFVFAVTVLQVKPWLVGLILAAAFVFNLQYSFAIFGFFDTWWNFRLKLRQLADARKQPEK